MRIAVVGAGVTGLAAAREVQLHAPNVELHVLEAGARPGGLVRTERTGGLVLEHGADSLFAFKPHAVGLIRSLGLGDDLVHGTGSPRTAYIARGASLVPLPAGVLAMTPRSAVGLMLSRLLTPGQKLRLLGEPFVRRRREEGDESLRDFVARRFGTGMLEQIIEPLISGIHGAPTDYLSAEAVMPNLVAFERSAGSIARALFRGRDREPEGPAIVSLRRGMGSFADALGQGLGKVVRYGVPVQRIRPTLAGALTLELGEQGALTVDAVVLATDAWTSARLCRDIAPRVSTELEGIESAGYASVHLAYRRAEVGALPEGTGFVVPKREGRALKACTWVDQKWPDRAPGELVLLRCFLRPPFGPPAELVAAARKDVEALLGLGAEPVFEHTVVRERALPCFTLGHLARVQRIEDALAGDRRLALAGNFLRGIGLSDCVASGQRAARAALDGDRALRASA